MEFDIKEVKLPLKEVTRRMVLLHSLGFEVYFEGRGDATMLIIKKGDKNEGMSKM